MSYNRDNNTSFKSKSNKMAQQTKEDKEFFYTDYATRLVMDYAKLKGAQVKSVDDLITEIEKVREYIIPKESPIWTAK